MPQVISELIVSLDMCAKGKHSPGYFGYLGPELDAYFKAMTAEPHHTVMGRKTYQVLNDLPEEAKDEAWREMAQQPGYLFSRTLEQVDWPGLELIDEDMVAFVRKLKAGDGPEVRVLGSLSIIRQLAEADLLDLLRLVVCPLALPESGAEPVFEGWTDAGFELASTKVLDGRVLILDYRPAGPPPSGGEQESS